METAGFTPAEGGGPVSAKIADRLPGADLLHPGHMACAGCGERVAMRLALQILGRDTVFVIPACCAAVVDGVFPYSAMGVPMLHTAFETGASVATGVRASLDAQGLSETTVVVWAGDGGTFDIGFQALSAAAERNEDLLYVCYDNEAYMNTGAQRSSATPLGAWTTTTPAVHPKGRPKKDILAILAAHRIPYAATASVAFPEDLMGKVAKAKGIRGTRFLHVLAPCPSGWKYEPDLTIQLARLAVESCVFPLVEIEAGSRPRLTYVPPRPRPVAEYLATQGRFAHLPPEGITSIQQAVEQAWADLVLASTGRPAHA
ncbi:MAG: pyruvate synthase subunit beta [candidate division NC10 bacterium]|nr:pyruvate synthase subunit beta [candidate division NC10 bacterium]